KRFVTFDEWTEGTQPPIIDRDLWDRYRARRLNTRPYRTKTTIDLALRGLVICSECGRNLTVSGRGPNGDATETWAWRCGYKYDTKYPRHPGAGVTDRKAKDAVWAWIEAGAGTNDQDPNADETRSPGLAPAHEPSGFRFVWDAMTPLEQNTVLKRIIAGI